MVSKPSSQIFRLMIFLRLIGIGGTNAGKAEEVLLLRAWLEPAGCARFFDDWVRLSSDSTGISKGRARPLDVVGGFVGGADTECDDVGFLRELGGDMNAYGVVDGGRSELVGILGNPLRETVRRTARVVRRKKSTITVSVSLRASGEWSDNPNLELGH